MVPYAANFFRYESFPSRDIIETWAIHNESAGTDDEYEVAEWKYCCRAAIAIRGRAVGTKVGKKSVLTDTLAKLRRV